MPALERAGSGSGAAHRAGLIASQLLGIALCRYILKLPPVVEMSHDAIINEVGRPYSVMRTDRLEPVRARPRGT